MSDAPSLFFEIDGLIPLLASVAMPLTHDQAMASASLHGRSRAYNIVETSHNESILGITQVEKIANPLYLASSLKRSASALVATRQSNACFTIYVPTA